MGRAVATITSDSSPSSAESSFRELDDVFLQTQTRIWLGEVLHTRLDEQLPILDVLADGELLFDVSKVIWKMLLAKYAELKHVKVYKYKPFGSRKSSGKYMPYSNVDSFLNICKILGLNGIDLFSPSDVVEKRNIRKVCMCIRSFSKKARSKDLKVPDFDIVTYTVAMPTDMVGCLRKSLELSQFSLSSCASHSPQICSRSNSMQKKDADGDRTSDSCSEGSYEAESIYMELHSPSANDSCYIHSEKLLDIENSTERQNISSSNIQNLERNVEEESTTGSVESMSSVFGKYDYQIESMFTTCNDSQTKSSANSGQKLIDLDLGLRNDACFTEEYIDDNADCSSSTKNDYQHEFGGDSFHDFEDVEVSSMTSVSSNSAQMLYDEDHVDSCNNGIGLCDTTNLCSDDEDDEVGTHMAELDPDIMSDCSSDSVADVLQDISGECADEQQITMEKHSPSTSDVSNYSVEGDQGCEEYTGDNYFVGLEEKTVNTIIQEEKEHENVGKSTEEISDGTSGKVPQGNKLSKKLILKRVVKGSAIVGVLFFLLHLRNRSGNIRRTGEETTNPNQIQNSNGVRKEERNTEAGGNGVVYPAEKLKFGF